MASCPGICLKTWHSLSPRFRPLPGRTNIVITRQANWQADGALTATSLDHALRLCGDAQEAWVMGGAQIYALALALAERVEVTEIDQNFDGDAFAPTLGSDWLETAREAHTASSGLNFSFVTYRRADPP